MKESISKAKGQATPFEPAGKNKQKFYEELASMPSASNGKKTDPTAVKRLVMELKSDK